MARKSYVSPDGVAREAKKIYLGDASNLAAIVTKAYIGIGGVARPWWEYADAQGGTLTYYGPITAGQSVRTNYGWARAGNYALFAGGEFSSVYNHVDAYDSSYTRRIPTGLSSSRTRLAGASTGGCALFAGGTGSNVVECYDADLTRTAITALSGGGEFPAGVSDFNGFALFCGGQNAAGAAEAYDETMTRHAAAAASVGHYNHRGEKTGGYALFAGGYVGSSRSAVVNVYDGDLSRSTATGMSYTRSHFGSAQVGKYALFAGGYYGSSGNPVTASVDAYDNELVKTAAPNLDVNKMNPGGGSLDGYAIFVGGYTGSVNVATALAYDENLSKETLSPASMANNYYQAVTLSNSAIFFGNGQSTEVYKLM